MQIEIKITDTREMENYDLFMMNKIKKVMKVQKQITQKNSKF